MKVKHILGIILLIILVILIKNFYLDDTKTAPKVNKQQPKFLYNITGEDMDLPLKEPACAITDKHGNVYVSDAGNHRGVVFNKKGKLLFEFGGSKSEKPLIYPYGIGILADKIIVADSGAGSIYEYSSEGKYSKTWSANIAKFQPAGVFVAPDLTVYISDLYGKQIMVFSEQGVFLRSIKSSEISLGAPQGLALDKQGNIWLADGANFNIKQLKQNGELLNIFDGGPKQTLATPKGLALDNTGKIYVADTLANTVRIFNNNGTDFANFGATGEQQGALKLPIGITIDGQDKIFVADQGNNRIQVWGWE